MTDFTNEERKKFDEEYEKHRKVFRPTVLVCGGTGVGKSSLIKTMLNVNVPINDGSPCTKNFDVYETDFIRVYDSKGMERGETTEEFVVSINEFIAERRTNVDIENRIHLVWYAIDASGARWQEGDKAIIDELGKIVGKGNIVFVFTKCDIAREPQIEAIKEKLKTESGIDDRRIILVCDDEGMEKSNVSQEIKNGVKHLLEHSLLILPEALHFAMLMAQKIDIDKKIETIKSLKGEAIAIVSSATVAASAAALIPIPFVANTTVITPIQIGMVSGLAAIYSIGISKESIFPFIASVVGRQAAASLVTLIPGFGSFINAGIATIITGGIGRYCMTIFEKRAIAKAKGETLPELKLDLSVVGEFIKNYEK
ncbi:MAG: GTP-binding DUF697 domain-containing protein [Fusobacteriaceae bacterium]|jgi:uncharacterized protein (DUF697 family)/GTP-binding protein EngB required for normal cell division|nr:GTP-binding DUF697 domain-containing protein [Fusobacteriaceae bacterium]